MNETITTQSNKLVLRRLSEQLFETWQPTSMDVIWIATLGIILLVAFFYVGWMYLRDSRSVGPWWASLLGLLRSCVYIVLALVFLLPAYRTWEEVRSESKVVVVFDVSESMETRDDIPDENMPFNKLKTRQEKILEFLSEKEFFPKLAKKNPITLYRFANRADEGAAWVYTKDGSHYPRAQYDTEVRGKPGAPRQVLPAEFLINWLRPTVALKDMPDTWPKGDADRWWEMYENQVRYNEARRKEGFFDGTNLGATKTVFDREIKNPVQGIVVFTDGRMNQGADFYEDLEKAAKGKVPIFVVGVGSVRPQVRIDLASIRAPKQIQPDDKFRVLMDVIGDGMADKEFDISLDVWAVKKSGPADKQIETPADLQITEQLNASDKMKKPADREAITLIEAGKKLTLKPNLPEGAKVKFDRSTPPRAEVEFVIDAASLAKEAKVDLEPKKRYEFVSPESGAEEQTYIRFQARVPKDKLEIFEDKEHLSKLADVRIFKKKLSVLLMASGPTRDYQFARTLFVREMEKERAELCIYLQLPPGMREPRKGTIVQDVVPERLLTSFPQTLDEPTDDKSKQFYDLSHYDVILAFDPDWSQLSDKEIKNLHTWVDKGGGLVVIGGPINTVQLASPGNNKVIEKYAPLADLYPVVLDDIRLREEDSAKRKTDDPYKLLPDAASDEMEFLKLSEQGDTDYQKDFRLDWEQIWGKDKDGKPERGIYNFYPVERAKTGALVVFRFGDPEPKSRLKDGSLHPYMVLSDPKSGRRVMWIGSGEIWRMRAYRETWHERFYIKLARYAAAGSSNKTNKRITALMEPVYNMNRSIAIDFKIDAAGGIPLGKPKGKDKPPSIKLKPPAGVNLEGLKAEQNMLYKADGLWGVQFQLRAPGTYGLTVTVPETNDTESFNFKVEETSIEKENTRPDFEAMLKLASDAGSVLSRVSAADKIVLESSLRAAQRGASADDKLKLLFDLKSAEMIPNCMSAKDEVTSNKGPLTDIWDEGFTIYNRSPADGGPIKLSYVLLLVVGLLSIEWLTRKLLRLA
jgi:von Willebrand factor type A domain